jgi:hypothetical protein
MDERTVVVAGMTHKDLVKRMVTWLKNSRNCGVVMAELRTMNSETPDALGFHGAGDSILIECKTSRADFFADGQKHFRQFEENGMGDLRYFATPPDLVTPSEVPAGWGLLYVGNRTVNEIEPAVVKTGNKRAEVKMLMSVIRRLEISTAVFVTHEESEMKAAWSVDPPTEPGSYEIRCGEAPEPSVVAVYTDNGELWVRDENIGTCSLDHYHSNLTDPEWRRVG